MNAEDAKKIDSIDNETFLRVFKKDHQFHSYLDAVVARRFSRMSVDLRSKSLEVYSLLATVEDLKGREARFVTTVESSDIVQDFKKKVNVLKVEVVVHEEAVLKMQQECDAEREGSRFLREKVDSLKYDRVRLVTEVILYVSRSLLYSDEVSQLLGEMASAERAEERSTVLEEFVAEGKCDLQCRGDFIANASHDLEIANQKRKEAIFRYLKKVVANPMLM
uniref:uncharacterized protein LOC122589674 n=1 Tax=Erigeron canadensis TaxID=72917 RepID=UPI001CB97DE1|nr:uncharacterized protein LOC122589674 [Erigeron canadensis]